MMGDHDNGPAMICCRHGKDRTGVLAVLLHGAMGRDRDNIVRDYARTKVCVCVCVFVKQV